MNHYFNAIYLSERSGTGFWRATMQDSLVGSIEQRTCIHNTLLGKPIGDEKWYENLNSFMVQRLIGNEQRKLYEKFVVPVCSKYNVWTIYNLDDAPHYKDIPPYNRGRWNYAKDQTQENIKSMMNSSDFILTTTDYLKNYFHRTYEVPLDNIVAIPNYLPRWWIGNYFDPERAVERFRQNAKKKLRIGIISSLSHYNIDHIRQDPNTKDVIKEFEEDGKKVWKNPQGKIIEDISSYIEVEDDLSMLLPIIEKTMDKIMWVFLGYLPPPFEQYAKEGKIEYHHSVPIYSYPQAVASLKLNFIVAPLLDNEFNRCKSNIKWLEACAFGIPLYASKVSPTYTNYMPENQLFTDANDLEQKIEKITKMSATVYQDIVMRQWKWLNSPHKECGFDSPNWWLEDNLDPWIKLWTMRKKALNINLGKFLDVRTQRREEEKKTTVFSKNNGELEIKF